MGILLREGSGSTATLWLNRPDARNALSIELCHELRATLQTIHDDTSIRVVVLRGKGPVFCAGADFDAVAGPRASDFLSAFEALLRTLAGCRAPTVAVLHGAALGGGLQLATACDFRIAAAGTRLGVPAARLGIVVDFENVRRLVLLVGPARAKEILMAEREVGTDDAVAWGLLTATAESSAVGEVVDELTARLGALAPLAVEGMKAAVDVVSATWGDQSSAGERVASIHALVGAAYASNDLREGIAALREKRRPSFSRS